jgi:hypothetical protein
MSMENQIIETYVSLLCQLERCSKSHGYDRAAGNLKLWGIGRLQDDIKAMQAAIEKEALSNH